MISGGCTGSTSGGVKNLRLLIMFQNIRNQFRQMLHSRAVLPVHINNGQVPVQTSALVYTFFVTYLICIFIGWTLLMCFGVGLTESFSTVISAIGNVGPGLGAFGRSFHGLLCQMRQNGFFRLSCLLGDWKFWCVAFV